MRGVWFVFLFLAVLLLPGTLNAGPDQLPIVLEKIEFYLQKGNALNAKEWLFKAKSINPRDPQVLALTRQLEALIETKVTEHLSAAAFAESNKDVPKAIEQYRAVLRFRPQHAAATVKLSEMQELQAKVTSIVANTGISAAPSSGKTYDLAYLSGVSNLSKARSALGNGNLEVSLGLVDQVLGADPTNREAAELRKKITQHQELKDLVSGAGFKSNSGDYQQAEEYYDKLLAQNPNRLDLLILRAKAKMKQRKYQAAIDDFLKAFQKGFSFEGIRGDLITCFSGLDDYERAFALASGNSKVKAYGTPNFRAWCIWKTFPAACMLIGLSLVSLLGAFIWTVGNFSALLEKGRLGSLFEAAKTIYFCLTSDPVPHFTRLANLAKILNNRWLHYLTGLLLLTNERFLQSQEHLQQALSSPGLAPRAHFFLGVARSQQNHALSKIDFEKVIISGLAPHSAPWSPGFLQKLEEQLLEKFAPKKDTDPLVKLSWQTFRSILDAEITDSTDWKGGTI